jgi:hypothetical protein
MPKSKRVIATTAKPAKPAKPAKRGASPDAKPATGRDLAVIGGAKANGTVTPKATRKPSVTRDAATIEAARYPAANVSARDESYIAFYAAIGADKKPVSLADIADKFRANPFYAGSSKATDAGAAERAVKHGLAEYNAAARTIKLTPRGASLAATVIKRDKLTLPASS